MMEKQTSIKLRMTIDNWHWLKKDAEKNMRSLNSHIIYILEKERKIKTEQGA